MLSLLQLRLSFMMKICTLFLLLGFTSCTMRQATKTPAAKEPVRESSMQVYRTTRNNFTLTVTAKSDGEPMPGALIGLGNGTLISKYGGITNLDGKWQINVFPDSITSMKISYGGYIPLLIVNMQPQPGDSIAVKLEVQHYDTVFGCRFDYPPMNDPTSPQNKTIERKEIRRMPK